MPGMVLALLSADRPKHWIRPGTGVAIIVGMTYKVHIGYTRAGRNRWRRFSTLETASQFCERVRQATGIILSILEG